MIDAVEPVVDGDLEERLLANAAIQAQIVEARAHPERRVPRRDHSARREALRRHEESSR